MIGEYDEKNVGYERAKNNIDTILKSTLSCKKTGKIFKILPQELAFYIQNKLAIPTYHPTIRLTMRM